MPDAVPTRKQPDQAVSDAEQIVRALCHEVSALVDGALRYVEMARRDLGGSAVSKAESHLAAASSSLHEVVRTLRAVDLGNDSDRRLPMSRLATLRPAIEAIEHAADIARSAGAARGIQIVLTIDSAFRALPPVPIFPVVSNGLRNALDATPRGGTIEVRARVERAPARAVLEILDDGPGPTRDAESNAFQLGYTTRPRGLGVGLALCRAIIDDLGGQVRLTSRAAVDGRRGGALVAWWPVVEAGTIGNADEGANGKEGRAA